MTIQDMAAALAARDAGMASSAEHAEEVQPGWGDRAFEAIRAAVTFGVRGDFTMEGARVWAELLGVPQPPELRAWGSVTVRLIREGIIEKTGGFAPATSSNNSPKPLYRIRGKA